MKRLALGANPSTDQLFDFFDPSWIYVREHLPETGDPRAHEIEWVSGEDDEHHIAYVNDHLGGVQFFAVWSSEPGKEKELEKELFTSPFAVMKHEEVFQEFERARSRSELVRSFGKVAVIAPPVFDQAFQEPVHRVLEHEDAAVRAAALGLLTYMLWPQWKPLVTKMIDDPDSEVRRKAQIVLDAYRELVEPRDSSA